MIMTKIAIYIKNRLIYSAYYAAALDCLGPR
jgi:hypothetical protein